MKFWLLSVLSSLSLIQVPSRTEKMWKARIVCLKAPQGHWDIQAYCQSTAGEEQRLRYDMLVKKHGNSGSSTNHQSGWATLAASQTKVLSQVRVNVQAADTCAVHLTLFDQAGQLLAQDSLRVVQPAQ